MKKVIIIVAAVAVASAAGAVGLRLHRAWREQAALEKERRQHEEVMASLDFSSVVSAGKSLCAAINDGSWEAIEAALGPEAIEQAASNCNGLARFHKCQAEGHGQASALFGYDTTGCSVPKDYKDESCGDDHRKRKYAEFIRLLRGSGSRCKALFNPENPADEMTIVSYKGEAEQVRFAQTASGWRVRSPVIDETPLVKAQMKMAVDEINR